MLRPWAQKDNDALFKTSVILALQQGIRVQHALVVAYPPAEVVQVPVLDFHVVDAVRILHVDVQADAVSGVERVKRPLRLGIFHAGYLHAEHAFQCLPADFPVLHDDSEHEVVMKGQLLERLRFWLPKGEAAVILHSVTSCPFICRQEVFFAILPGKK